MTRRGALRGLAAGPALLLVSCGGEDERAAARAADLRALADLLDAELATLAVYRAGAEVLSGDAQALLRRFGAHERAHADAVLRAIRDLGGAPGAKPPAVEVPREPSRILRLAAEREAAAVTAHLDALARLSRPGLRAGAAPLLATAAAHLAVLHDALGEEPAPAALLLGTPA